MELIYGGSNDYQMLCEEVEKRFIEVIYQMLKCGGKVFILVMVVGRVQEIMMVFEEYVCVGGIEVFIYFDGMIWEVMVIYIVYLEYFSKYICEQIFYEGYNLFLNLIFKSVVNSRERQDIIDLGELVIIIVIFGMFVGGLSVEYFKQFVLDLKNSIIFVSYQVEGIFGRQVQRGFCEIFIVGEDGRIEVINVNMEVYMIDGFLGYVDRREFMSYVVRVRLRLERIIIVYGEVYKCFDFSFSIYKKFGILICVFNNLDVIRFK